jgi:hypothetical protein
VALGGRTGPGYDPGAARRRRVEDEPVTRLPAPLRGMGTGLPTQPRLSAAIVRRPRVPPECGRGYENAQI